MADPLPGGTGPRSVAHSVSEPGHVSQNSVDLRNGIVTVDFHRCRCWETQRSMQSGALFSGVDRRTTKHRSGVFTDPALAGKVTQGGNNVIGDEMTGVVKMPPGSINTEPVGSPGVVCEQVAQVGNRQVVLDAAQMSKGRLGPAPLSCHSVLSATGASGPQALRDCSTP